MSSPQQQVRKVMGPLADVGAPRGVQMGVGGLLRSGEKEEKRRHEDAESLKEAAKTPFSTPKSGGSPKTPWSLKSGGEGRVLLTPEIMEKVAQSSPGPMGLTGEVAAGARAAAAATPPELPEQEARKRNLLSKLTVYSHHSEKGLCLPSLEIFSEAYDVGFPIKYVNDVVEKWLTALTYSESWLEESSPALIASGGALLSPETPSVKVIDLDDVYNSLEEVIFKSVELLNSVFFLVANNDWDCSETSKTLSYFGFGESGDLENPNPGREHLNLDFPMADIDTINNRPNVKILVYKSLRSYCSVYEKYVSRQDKHWTEVLPGSDWKVRAESLLSILNGTNPLEKRDLINLLLFPGCLSSVVVSTSQQFGSTYNEGLQSYFRRKYFEDVPSFVNQIEESSKLFSNPGANATTLHTIDRMYRQAYARVMSAPTGFWFSRGLGRILQGCTSPKEYTALSARCCVNRAICVTRPSAVEARSRRVHMLYNPLQYGNIITQVEFKDSPEYRNAMQVAGQRVGLTTEPRNLVKGHKKYKSYWDETRFWDTTGHTGTGGSNPLKEMCHQDWLMIAANVLDPNQMGESHSYTQKIPPVAIVSASILAKLYGDDRMSPSQQINPESQLKKGESESASAQLWIQLYILKKWNDPNSVFSQERVYKSLEEKGTTTLQNYYNSETLCPGKGGTYGHDVAHDVALTTDGKSVWFKYFMLSMDLVSTTLDFSMKCYIHGVKTLVEKVMNESMAELQKTFDAEQLRKEEEAKLERAREEEAISRAKQEKEERYRKVEESGLPAKREKGLLKRTMEKLRDHPRLPVVRIRGKKIPYLKVPDERVGVPRSSDGKAVIPTGYLEKMQREEKDQTQEKFFSAMEEARVRLDKYEATRASEKEREKEWRSTHGVPEPKVRKPLPKPIRYRI